MSASSGSSDVVILVSALDTFAACWEPFCYGLKKFWPDCPWPLKFITNTRDPPCGSAIKVATTDWTDMNKEGVSRAGASVVLWMLEDYWLTQPVDTAAMVDFANLVLSGKADYIRTCRQCDTEKYTYSDGDFQDDPRLYIFSNMEPYRTSLQVAFWRTSVFLDMFEPDQDPWQFEISHRSHSNPRFLCVKECKYIRYTSNVDPEFEVSAMSRGLWTETAHTYAEREGISIDLTREPWEGLDV